MSNSITRTYSFANGGVADGGQVDSEVQNIVNTINNADAGTTTWTQVKVATLTSTTSTILKGSATSDSAAAGNIGEYIESLIGDTAATTSGNYSDGTSISLTAGDWDVSALVCWQSNSGTWSEAYLGISQTTGNSATGLTLGQTMLGAVWANSSTTPIRHSLSIPTLRVSLSATTTIYLKLRAVYSAGTPHADGGRLSARRVR